MSLDLSGISALILAGEREGPNLLLRSEAAVSKAEIDIGGRPMLDHVLASVRESGLAQPLYLAGSHETTRARLSGSETGRGIEHLPAGPGPAASVLSSLDRIGRYPLLVTTSDHPLLSPGMIRVFIERSLASGADLTVGLASRTTIEAVYPDAARTYFPIGGQKVSGCNLFLLTSPEAMKAIRFWTEAEADRKHPARIARRFGFLNALRMLRPGISFENVFRVLSRRLGCSVKPVLLDQAEAAIDVDKPEDLALVRKIMARESV